MSFLGGKKKDKSPPRSGPGILSPKAAPPPQPKKPLYTKAEVPELVKGTVFDPGDIPELAKMYEGYTTSATNAIPVEKMRDLPQTSVFPLFQRVVQMHNTDNVRTAAANCSVPG